MESASVTAVDRHCDGVAKVNGRLMLVRVARADDEFREALKASAIEVCRQSAK
jgi:hypothetical protein